MVAVRGDGTDDRNEARIWRGLAIAMAVVNVVAVLAVVRAVNPTTGTIAQPGSLVESPSITVFTDGTNYFARNGTTGAIGSSSSNATTVVQFALNSVPAGGMVFVKAGNYTISAQVLIPSAVTLRGEGMGYQFVQPTTMLWVSSSSWGASVTAPVFKAKGEDVNGFSEKIRISNLWFRAPWPLLSAHAILLDMTKGPYAVIEDNYFKNCPWDCVALGQSTRFLNNHIDSPGRAGIVARNDGWIVGNEVGGAVQTFSYATSGALIGGIVDNFGANQIAYNQVYLTKYGPGINLQASTGDIVQGNFVHDNWFNGFNLTTATNNTITGNTIYANSYACYQCFSGIILRGSSSLHNVIANNYVGPKGNQIYGIWESGSSDYSVIVGNDVTDGGSVGKIAASGAHSIIRSNLGYNPIGKITNPFGTSTVGLLGTGAAPSSATAYTVTCVDVYIRTSGGTVSNITVSDAAGNLVAWGMTTTTTGLFVAIGYKITWTFSAVPTVAIFGN